MSFAFSDYEPRPSLYKYRKNFKLNTSPISDKSHTSPFLEIAVISCHFIRLADFLYPFVDGEF